AAARRAGWPPPTRAACGPWEVYTLCFMAEAQEGRTESSGVRTPSLLPGRQRQFFQRVAQEQGTAGADALAGPEAAPHVDHVMTAARHLDPAADEPQPVRLGLDEDDAVAAVLDHRGGGHFQLVRVRRQVHGGRDELADAQVAAGVVHRTVDQ